MTDFKDNAADLENLCKVFRERFQGPPAHSRKPEKGVKAIQKEKKKININSKKVEVMKKFIDDINRLFDVLL